MNRKMLRTERLDWTITYREERMSHSKWLEGPGRIKDMVAKDAFYEAIRLYKEKLGKSPEPLAEFYVTSVKYVGIHFGWDTFGDHPRQHFWPIRVRMEKELK